MSCSQGHSSSSDGVSSNGDDFAPSSTVTATVPNSPLQSLDAHATDPESVVDGTPETQFCKEDWQSYGSEFHKSAHPSKPQCLPSVRSRKRSKSVVPQSDLFEPERDS
jgi:hypothetical protein